MDTIEITIKQTKVLRNNMLAIQDAEEATRHTSKAVKLKKKSMRHNPKAGQWRRIEEQAFGKAEQEFSFHTPRHCLVSPGEGEFVFMGRRRFDEMMLICAPRLDEWARLVQKFTTTNQAPCILAS